MAVALGGRVAEEIVYARNEVTRGFQRDLKQVARWLVRWLTPSALSDRLARCPWPVLREACFLGRDIRLRPLTS